MLGIDPGSKRFGLAVGDTTTGFATSLEVVKYGGRVDAAKKIEEFMISHAAESVVIGLPTNVDGDETPACRRSHALSEAVADLGITAVLQPEYLSTDEARRRARALGRKSSQPVDDLAAQVILEEYFERHGAEGRAP